MDANVNRGTLRVGRDSWHYKLYGYWVRHATWKAPATGYRENLCHYVRVVLFWATFSWFVNAHPRRASWVRPWSVLAAVLGLGTAAFLTARWPGEVAQVLLVSLGVVAAVAAVAGLIALAIDHEEAVRGVFRTATRPLVWALCAFGRLVYAVLAPPFRRIGDFVDDHADGIYLTVCCLFGAAAAAGLVALAVNYPWQTLLVAGLVLAAALVVTGLVFVAIAVRDGLRRCAPPVRYARPAKDKGDGGLKVAAHFAVAKKAKICPFIELPS
jgi:hypothetical protein